MDYCLREAGLAVSDVDLAACYDKPPQLLGKDPLDMKMNSQDTYWRERPRGQYRPVQTEKMY